MIAFAQYAAGTTSIKPASGHVMGWMVRDFISDREYLYALCEDGRVLRCDAPSPTVHFDTRQRTWWPVKEVPPCAQWIGYYPMPRKIAKVAGAKEA